MVKSDRSEVEVRVARPEDVFAVNNLISHARHRTMRDWWWNERLGSGTFRLALVGGSLVGALFACVEVGPVAWVQMAAHDGRVGLDDWLGSGLRQLLPALRMSGARRLLWMDADGWPGTRLQRYGFRRESRIVSLAKLDRILPAGDAPEICVRPVRADEIATVARVDRRSFTPPWWLGTQTLQRLRQHSPCFLVAEHRGRCVGYVEAHMPSGRAHIGRLAVDQQMWGMGVGGVLLAEALKRLWRLGAEAVTLNTQQTNRTSQRLYDKFGFRPFGVDVDVWGRYL